jgi:hypothetical protein
VCPRVVGLVTKQLVSPDRHVALTRELIIRGLPVYDLEDFLNREIGSHAGL